MACLVLQGGMFGACVMSPFLLSAGSAEVADGHFEAVVGFADDLVA